VKHSIECIRSFALLAAGVIALTVQGCSSSSIERPERPEGIIRVVYQPSHQTDTGKDFSEAEVCNNIAEAAMNASSGPLAVSKVWSYDVPGLRFARRGSNTMINHTSAVVGDSLTGYAWELRESNRQNPFVFIAIHNNGATNRHAIWGFIHEGDKYEMANRELATELVEAIVDATGLENRGILFDSSTGRNDYRCSVTGKLAFYSIDENVNTAPYRVLLEIGDNAASREFLLNPSNQKILGQTIAKVLVKQFGRQ
jgi:hypothetical protein